ncbi:MAG: hypothetical protein ACXV8Q_13585 [Methylobacter sp.]
MRKIIFILMIVIIPLIMTFIVPTANAENKNQIQNKQKYNDHKQGIDFPSCLATNLTQGIVGYQVVNGDRYYVRRMATIFDNALDDFGVNNFGNELEIFCVSNNQNDTYGKIAMCLTGEECPWTSTSNP